MLFIIYCEIPGNHVINVRMFREVAKDYKENRTDTCVMMTCDLAISFVFTLCVAADVKQLSAGC